jgi:hypothetical protein
LPAEAIAKNNYNVTELRQCLDPFKLPKILQDSPSHRIFRRMHGVLNVGKKKLITQFVCKCRDESFEPG